MTLSDGRYSKEDLKQLESFLLPGEAVADTIRGAEIIFIGQVPAVVANQGVLIGMLGVEIQHLPGFIDRHKRIFRCGFVDPGI